MAKYYAITKDGYVQRDVDTDQLEIYETAKAANMAKRSGMTVTPVNVSKSND